MSAAQTPMFKQYLVLKAEHPDALLFYRMGDFYEMFWEDAELAAQLLELTLTSRNKNDEDPIPMAGVPHHAVDAYVQRLTEAGYKVAIAEQMEDPATAKGLVRRAITRVVTPGLVLNPSALDAHRANHLAAVYSSAKQWGVAFLDLSTGDFRATTLGSEAQALREVERMEPPELLLPLGLLESPTWKAAAARMSALLSTLEESAWRPTATWKALTEAIPVLPPKVAERGPDSVAAGALLSYAKQMSGSTLTNVKTLTHYLTDRYLILDDSTRRNLELFTTVIDGKRKGSLIGLLDQCATPMGSRLMREWLGSPSVNGTEIQARHEAVQHLAGDLSLREQLRSGLRKVGDLERLSARVAQGTANPRDMDALRRSLLAIPEICAGLPAVIGPPKDKLKDLAKELNRWLQEDPPLLLTEGGIIRSRASEELDKLVALSAGGLSLISELETKERKASGIFSLKIRRNKVFGFYIEITNAHRQKVPERYTRKQTLTGGERYITPELKELEDSVLHADERSKQLEHQLFLDLRSRFETQLGRVLAVASALARLDVYATLAELATRHRWVRPEIVEDGRLEVSGGRHPVVEALLTEERYVPNDLRLHTKDRSLIVLTGPNMAGKSTVIRAAALWVILAQMGSFVPADRAIIGLTDRVFTRVGAADHLTKGQSTFMVEMSETATILHHATARSLVILDEIGRGTSTYDGLAIAWAVATDLVARVQCRTLFATHFHELCELAETHPTVTNQSMAVRELGEEIVFLRTLKEGGASRSYGIQCARIAGLPKAVVNEALGLLTRFEKHAPPGVRTQLQLFSPPPPTDVRDCSSLRSFLEKLDLDSMSPREAQAALYQALDLARS